MSIEIIQIEKKYKDIFKDLIDMSDYKEENEQAYNNALLSRSLAAHAISIMTDIEHKEAAKCVTDGTDDYGIDAFYNDSFNKQLILVQSKWHYNAASTIEKGDVYKFIQGINKVINLDFSDFNKKITDRQSELESAIRELGYKVLAVIVFPSSNDISAECYEPLDDYIKKTNILAEHVVPLTIRLKDIYDNLAKGYFESVDINNLILHNWGVYEVEGKNKGYYGTISALQLAEYMEQYGIRFFSKNIRLFKGDTEVNQGIKHIIDTEPGLFYFYNNGIKIIASKVNPSVAHSADRKVAILNLENANIVNGAQTTGSIYDIYKSKPDQLSGVAVHVQIIELFENIPNIDEKITKYSNTQNRIEKKDFASQDEEQERLRKALILDGIEYLYKSGNSSPAFDKHCSLDDATISLGCFLDDVAISTIIKSEIGSIFDDLTKHPYKAIFNASTSSYRLWNTVTIYRRLEKISSEYQKLATKQHKLISVHGNRFILHIILDILKKGGLDFDKSYINNENETIGNLNTLYSDLVDKIVTLKTEMYTEDSYPAYIFKNITKCGELKSKLTTNYKANL